MHFGSGLHKSVLMKTKKKVVKQRVVTNRLSAEGAAAVAAANKARAFLWTQAIENEIAERIAQGETMTSICAREGMPCTTGVHLRRIQNPEWEKMIARARVIGFDAIADDCVTIADKSASDSGEGGAVHVQRDRLRVDTRLKLLAKWDPKRYGEQAAQTNVTVGVAVAVAMPEDRRAKIMALRRASQVAKCAQPESVTDV